MKTKPIAAFGTVVFLCDAEANETRNYVLSSDGSYQTGHYYYVSGLARNTVIETGEVIPDRTPGWLNLEHPGTGSSTPGTVKIEYLEDTQWLCIPHIHNPQGLSVVTKLIVDPGTTSNIAQGSNLLLVRGKLLINNRLFTGPTQIRVRSGDVIASPPANAVEPSYCLFFP